MVSDICNRTYTDIICFQFPYSNMMSWTTYTFVVFANHIPMQFLGIPTKERIQH